MIQSTCVGLLKTKQDEKMAKNRIRVESGDFDDVDEERIHNDDDVRHPDTINIGRTPRK